MLGILALYNFDPYGLGTRTLISIVVANLVCFWGFFPESNLGRCVTLKFGLF